MEKKAQKEAAERHEHEAVLTDSVISGEPELMASTGHHDAERASAKSEEEEPQMSVWMTIGLLVVVTVVCLGGSLEIGFFLSHLLARCPHSRISSRLNQWVGRHRQYWPRVRWHHLTPDCWQCSW